MRKEKVFIRTWKLCRYSGTMLYVEKPGGYYLGSREFELAELKLLVDAVQASKFITQKQSRNLIEKLEHFTSRHEANRLQRQVCVNDRVKTENLSSLYLIDDIHQAMHENQPVTF